MICKWPAIPLLDLYDVTNGLSKGKEDFGHGFPFLTFKEVFNSYFVPDTLTNLANTSPQEQKKCSIREGDVFITRTSETFDELGMSCVALKNYDNATFNGFCKRLRPKPDTPIYAKYAAFYFGSNLFRDQITALANMSTRASLNNDMLKHLVLHLPDIKTQKKIGEFLYKVTILCDNHDKTNQTLEEMAQAIFKSWFVDFDPVKAKAEVIAQGGSEQDANLAAMQIISGKTRDQLAALEHTHPEQYTQLHTTASLFPSALVDSELGEIPEGWVISTIGNEFDITMGQSPPGETYNENKEGMIFYQGRRDFGDRFPQPRVYCTAPKRTAKKGDVLLSVRAPVGDLNIAETDCCIGRGLAAIRHKSGDTSISYYTFMFLKKQFESFNTEGTVFGAVNKDSLSSIQIIKPSKLITSAFTSATNPLDELIFSNHFEINALKEARDILLPKLLSGEIDISQLNLND